MSTATVEAPAGTRVEVYRNIHKSRRAGRPVYSVRDAKTKRVIAHESLIVLTDAKFKVSEAGRQRVLREKRKNVHAVIEGTWVEPGSIDMSGPNLVVLYNPYKFSTFVADATKQPVHTAPIVEIGLAVLAWGIYE